MKNLLFLTILMGLLASSACKKGDNHAAEDRKLIVADLAAKGLTATEDPSGLFYIIDTPGDSTHPNVNSKIKFTYKGYTLDGSVFDQQSVPVQYFLYDLIEGWQIGIPFLGKGGRGTFWIPSRLGYGGTAQPGIPANSVLIFEISLKSFY